MVEIRGFLIDLDGTLYIGDRPVAGAKEFVTWLQDKNIPFLLLTNNSTRTPYQVRDKLQKMGIEVNPAKIYTSANALGDYIREYFPGKHGAFVIGEDGVKEELKLCGWEIVDSHLGAEFVVVGLDQHVDYRKLKEAVLAIQNGAKFVACNCDSGFPSPEGLLPGAGAIVNAITTVVGIEPVVLGKPNDYIIRYAVRRLGTELDKTAIVGDRLDTDILLGKKMGMITMLVLTGVVKSKEEISRINPDFVFKDVEDLWGNIFRLL